MEFNYKTIKQLAQETGRKVTDLIALAAANDPFYSGTPNEVALAEWFANFYHSNFAYGTKVHVRRCHYAIQATRMTLPSGEMYENTERCWDILLMATKAARYLGLVSADLFEDKKNDDPAIYSDGSYGYDPEIGVSSQLYTSDVNLPDFPGLPDYSLSFYRSRQRYSIELWCEKTTMNDVLLPLCQRYGMTLQTGAGELSITATKALADRIAANGKPTRIFYISDYDPAGQSMPVAVARKLEFFMRSEGIETDVRLFPVVLTAAQVQQYQLPRTPIKETEKRRESFEARHGQGATELDALEALHPGELRRVLRRYIEQYFDVTLEDRSRQARKELEDELARIRDEILEHHEEAIEERRSELEAIRAELGPRMEAYSRALQELWQAIGAELQEATPDLDEYPLPEAEEAKELGDGLYNSERDYLDQIDAYHAFQGK